MGVFSTDCCTCLGFYLLSYFLYGYGGYIWNYRRCISGDISIHKSMEVTVSFHTIQVVSFILALTLYLKLMVALIRAIFYYVVTP